MANVKTFNLSVYLPYDSGLIHGARCITFRGISRVAVERYKKYYNAKYYDVSFNVEAR